MHYSIIPYLSIAVWPYHNVKRRDCLVAWDRIVSSTITETQCGYFSCRQSTTKEMLPRFRKPYIKF
jgi:hypothetical protein